MSEDPRPVLIAKEVLDTLFTRDHLGNRLTVHWGDPNDDGFYEPVIVVDHDDNLRADDAKEIAQLREALYLCGMAAHNGEVLMDQHKRGAYQKLGYIERLCHDTLTNALPDR